MAKARIRPAQPSDVPQLLGLIRDLAAYEREPAAAVATEEQIHDALFGGSTTPTGAPAAYCFVVDVAGESVVDVAGESVLDVADESVVDVADEVAGLALYFLNFSTWLGRHGIYLEDLYVRPEFRGQGFGQALLARLARECMDRGYGRLEWSVLDWNTPAVEFYRSQGAQWMGDWTTNRVSGEALQRLAASSPRR